VVAPTSDSVLFRSSVLRALFILVPTMIVVWVLTTLLPSALFGRGAAWDALRSFPAPLVGAVVGFCVAAWLQRDRPTWIRVSDLGIELAQRGDPVFIAWSQIAVARVRRRWIFAVLEVRPADLCAVKCVLPSPYLPRIRYKRGIASFRIDVGAVRPGLRALRAALLRYRPTLEEMHPEPADV
jgi:hypothetical protein